MTQNLNCAACDELFPEYFEGELDAPRRAMVEAHAQVCARCQGFIRDITGISDEAASLPELAPSRDLWQGIEARIQPEVVPIGERHRAAGWSRRMLSLAAAALIVVSSSVTYFATRSLGDRSAPVRVVEAPRDVPIVGTGDEIGSGRTTASPESQNGTAGAGSPNAGSAAGAGAPTRSAPTQSAPNVGRSVERAAAPRTSLASAAKPAATSASELALAPEIARLQQTLKLRRSQLDPTTVQVVEDNLKVIDVAVKQARAALARDPASGFLTEQLDNALQKKIELLRTVAMLPSRS
ncbi:MAG: zf-HC2 domain-containing protein [Gemmatimonadales bacterium]